MNDLVVVGNGMAGVACVEEILKYDRRFDITIYGDETHVNYNRILLSSVLAGERSSDDITLNSLEWYQRHDIRLRLGTRIVEVDPLLKVRWRRTTGCCSRQAVRPSCRESKD